MNYEQVLEVFDCTKTVCIIVIGDDGNVVAVAEHNLEGGCCGCCIGSWIAGESEVLKVFDAVTGEIFYEVNK